MRKILATVTFVAAATVSGAAFAQTTYTVTGTNNATCVVTNTGASTTWAYGELFANGTATSRTINNDVVANITCNTGNVNFSMSSSNNGLTRSGAHWQTNIAKVDYVATTSFMGVDSNEIDTSDADSGAAGLSTGTTIYDGASNPSSAPLTVHLTTTPTPGGAMLPPGTYTDTLTFTITPQG